MHRNFTVQFKGAAGLAARRANQAFLGLKDPNGNWLDIQAVGPSQSSGQRKSVRLYMGRDKNKKTLRQEGAARKMWKALQAEHPDKSFHYLRNDAAITVDWQPLCRAEATAKSTNILWKPDIVAAHNISKAEALARFEAASHSVAGGDWCL